ncbi:hypothetical protein BDEG_25589 [Batrachochytrium dendrobatidis JEL423]|nr:hypothetical protein BDEG_25589 [Batrachochytrium dendrobatidis JEL423]
MIFSLVLINYSTCSMQSNTHSIKPTTFSNNHNLLVEADEIYPVYISLITDLFESMNAIASAKHKSLARSNIDSSAADMDKVSAPLAVLEKLKTLDIHLQSYRQSVESHQNLVLQVQAMKQDLDNRNKSVLMKMKRLHQAHEGLDSVLANARYKQKLMHKANQGSIDFNELLSYAQRVSKHTMSPINPNTWVIEPPIPQDSHMRMSLLFRQDQLLTEKTVQDDASNAGDHTMDLDLLSHDLPESSDHDAMHAETLLDLDFE